MFVQMDVGRMQMQPKPKLVQTVNDRSLSCLLFDAPWRPSGDDNSGVYNCKMMTATALVMTPSLLVSSEGYTAPRYCTEIELLHKLNVMSE